jgi:putative transposase
MPRIARGLADGLIYHIINRGNGKQEVFHKDADYISFIDLIKKAKARHPIEILAYCLMPNHFHLVLSPNGSYSSSLSEFMQWLMTSHVRRYHAHYETSGHIWQGRFKSFIVQEDNHLITVLRYVEGNPVKAGLVSTAKDWKWSSHKETIGEMPADILDKTPISLPKNWSKFVDESIIKQELEKLNICVNRQSPYGTTQWQEQICTNLALESTLRPRGRPRKEKLG